MVICLLGLYTRPQIASPNFSAPLALAWLNLIPLEIYQYKYRCSPTLEMVDHVDALTSMLCICVFHIGSAIRSFPTDMVLSTSTIMMPLKEVLSNYQNTGRTNINWTDR